MTCKSYREYYVHGLETGGKTMLMKRSGRRWNEIINLQGKGDNGTRILRSVEAEASLNSI
jgi:hypothetical protein